MGRELAAVAAGGAVGALARAGVQELLPRADGFPWATLGTNVVGSLLLALLSTRVALRTRPLLALALGPGVLGGFTTLSAYAGEARALTADGHPLLAAAYVVGTLAACLLAVVLVQLARPRPEVPA